jgi:hypothetical protein
MRNNTDKLRGPIGAMLPDERENLVYEVQNRQRGPNLNIEELKWNSLLNCSSWPEIANLFFNKEPADSG